VSDRLMVSTSSREIEEELRTVRLELIRIFGVTLLVTVLLSLYLASTIARPIRRLANAAQRARGRGARIEIPEITGRNDEIGELAGSLRAMTDALYRFGAGQDLRDRPLFESAFAPDASLDFTAVAAKFGVAIPVFEGRHAIADTIMAATEPLDTTHTITNVRVTAYDGNRAPLFIGNHFESWNGGVFSMPATRVRETAQFLRAALAGERVVFKGQTISVDGFRLTKVVPTASAVSVVEAAAA
jgi:HAMP domain-containing protein